MFIFYLNCLFVPPHPNPCLYSPLFLSLFPLPRLSYLYLSFLFLIFSFVYFFYRSVLSPACIPFSFLFLTSSLLLFPLSFFPFPLQFSVHLCVGSCILITDKHYAIQPPSTSIPFAPLQRPLQELLRVLCSFFFPSSQPSVSRVLSSHSLGHLSSRLLP